MDPLDRPRSLLGGISCSACEERVPSDRIRILAQREDLAFIEVECLVCGSTSLGLVAGDEGERGKQRHSPGAPARSGRATAPTVTTDDVLAMHVLLENWRGDVVGLLDPRQDPGALGSSR